MSQQPPYGQPSSQPRDYTRQAMRPAAQPEQPKFIARDPEPAQPAHRQTAGKHQPAGKRYGLTGAEPFWYVLGCIDFGAAYLLKLPAKKATSEILSELQSDGGGPSRGYGLTGAGTSWYMLMCILGFGGAYFAKVSADTETGSRWARGIRSRTRSPQWRPQWMPSSVMLAVSRAVRLPQWLRCCREGRLCSRDQQELLFTVGPCGDNCSPWAARTAP